MNTTIKHQTRNIILAIAGLFALQFAAKAQTNTFFTKSAYFMIVLFILGMFPLVTRAEMFSEVAVGQSVPGSTFPYDYETVGTGSYFNLRLQSFNNIVFHTGLELHENVTITANGSMGIGTTSPIGKLTVTGDAGDIRSVTVDSSEIKFRGDGVAHMSIYGPRMGKPYLSIGDTSANYAIGTASTETLVVTSEGQVGIGTSTPKTTLDIGFPAGNRLQFTYTRSALVTSNDNGGAIYFGSADVDDGNINPTAAIESSWGANFIPQISIGVTREQNRRSSVLFDFMGNAVFYAFNEERMRLDGAGNLGIGTSNITHKLTVNGAIRATEVIVDTGWADYVFADDYKLQSLDALEQHIKATKHLPGIPTAAEVGKQGVSLGDMQTLLLSKIEELTLHQIDLNKRLNAQDEKLDQQSRELEALRQENATLKSQQP